MIAESIKNSILNKAEEYSTNKWGYKNETHNNYLNDKQAYSNGYLQALKDISEKYKDISELFINS